MLFETYEQLEAVTRKLFLRQVQYLIPLLAEHFADCSLMLKKVAARQTSAGNAQATRQPDQVMFSG